MTDDEITIKLDEETRQQLRFIKDEKYDGQETSLQGVIKRLSSEECEELKETKAAIQAAQESLRESFGKSDEGDTSGKESATATGEAAERQAEIKEKFF